MNRRQFLTRLLAGAAAPLIARPTLEEIERLTWRRRFFPAYPSNHFLTPELVARESLRVLESNLTFARLVSADYQLHFHPEAFALVWPKIGETVQVRKPRRFVGR